MASVRELSAPYANFMLAPRPGPGVCRTCFNLTDGFDRCYACTRSPSLLDAVAPISYSVAHEQLHHALASYKRVDGIAGRRLTVQLAAVLWRYLQVHERCVARVAGASGFDLVTTIPSGDRARDERHPLRWVVGELIEPTRDRHERLLRRTASDTVPHEYSAERFVATRALTRTSVLLIDDTWTTGATAQSAASALRAAGAERIGAVVIGRHVNRSWHENDRRLRELAGKFDWSRCAFCRPRPPASA